MMRASLSLGTTLPGMPIPLPTMTDFMCGCAASCIRLRVQRNQIGAAEVVLPPTKFAGHVSAALVDHLLQLVGREERQRRQRALAAATAGVAERHVEARVDLLVVA